MTIVRYPRPHAHRQRLPSGPAARRRRGGWRRRALRGAALGAALGILAAGSAVRAMPPLPGSTDPVLVFTPAGSFEPARTAEVAVDADGGLLFLGTPDGVGSFELPWRWEAATGRWVPVAGQGDLVVRPIVDPHAAGRAVALSRERPGQVLRSEDGGRSWIRTGRAREILHRLVASPTTPGLLWATGFQGQDLWRSADGGATWELVARRFMGTLAAGAGGAEGGGDTLYSFNTAWIGRSEDGGRTWSDVTRGGAPFGGIEALAVSVSDPDVLYATPSEFRPACLSRTLDRGAHWEDLAGPELPEGGDGRCGAVVVDPRDARRLWMLAGFRDASGEVPWRTYESLDGGETWSAGRTLVAARRMAVLHAPPGESGIELLGFAGRRVWRSNDGGRSWRRADEGLTTESGLLLAAPGVGAVPVGAEPSRVSLWSGEGTGLFASEDGGDTWEQRTKIAHLKALVADAIDGRRLWAVRSSPKSAVWTSADGGDSWRRSLHFVGGAIFRFVYDVAVDPRAAGVAAASTNKDAYISRDAGRWWSNLTRRLPGTLDCHISGACDLVRSIYKTVFDPVVAGRVYVRGLSGAFVRERPGGPFHDTLFDPFADVLDPFVAGRFYHLVGRFGTPSGRTEILPGTVRSVDFGRNILPPDLASDHLRLIGLDADGRLLVLDENPRGTRAPRLLRRDLSAPGVAGWSRFVLEGLPPSRIERVLGVRGPGGGVRLLVTLRHGGVWKADLDPAGDVRARVADQFPR